MDSLKACCTSKQLPRRSDFWQQCGCAVLGGLLCSSCCIVQLALNSLSIGCAGFAVLTPYRPAFLSVTALTLAGNYIKYRNTQRTALALAIAFGLAITPELVQLYNESRLPLLPGFGARIKKEDTGALREVHVYVGGMKCLACAARVKSHLLQSVEGAGSCEVELETGRVTVRGKALSAESVIASAKDLGYEARLWRQPLT